MAFANVYRAYAQYDVKLDTKVFYWAPWVACLELRKQIFKSPTKPIENFNLQTKKQTQILIELTAREK